MTNHFAERLTPDDNAHGGLEHSQLTLAGPAVPEAWAVDHAFPPELLSRLDEINNTWRIIKDPLTETAFEVAEVNTDKPTNGVLDNSTFSSSLSGNPGNAFELAYRGMTNPDECRIYVATMGNGGSDNFSPKELAHLRKTGRLTDEEAGKPVSLPTIKALRRALDYEGWQPTKLSTDSFGGSIATALMAELKAEQISHAYIKGRPNISQRAPLKLAADMLLTEGVKHSKANYRNSTDAWKLSDWMIRETIAHLPNVYGAEVRHSGHVGRQLGSYLLGLSIGPSAGRAQTGPAFRDTRAALLRQPNALMTFEFPDQDLLYKRPADYEKFIIALGHVAGPHVQALVTPGTHGGHAYTPNARAASERHAFSRES